MPIMPPTAPRPASYPGDRADMRRAVDALERRLSEPLARPSTEVGVVTSLRPTVRMLGQSFERDVWRVNTGTELAVGDDVLCVDTAQGLVVLSVVVPPTPGPFVPSGPGPNLVPNPGPATPATQAVRSDSASLSASGWSSDGLWYGVQHIPNTLWIVVDYDWGTAPPYVYFGYHPEALPAGNSCLGVGCLDTETFLVWPCGPAAIAVTPGVQYSVSCYTQSQLAGTSGFTNRTGVRWFDSGGSVIATDYGPASPFVSDSYVWISDSGYPPDPATYGPSQSRPTATLTAPAGATHGQPLVQLSQPGDPGNWFWVAGFDMHTV